MSTPRVHISNHQVAKLPAPAIVAAVDAAFQALARGQIKNPPRVETLGRPGDPDYFRIEMTADWRGRDGAVQWRCRKVIEEAGARDVSGNRALGRRATRMELDDVERNRSLTLDADAITNVRTAVSALVGARYLISPRPVTLAVVGSGRVGRSVARYAEHVLPVETIRLWSRTKDRRERAVAELAPTISVPIEACESVGECVGGADVVVAAVPSPEPIVTYDVAHDARHVTLVGGDPRVVLADRALWTSRVSLMDEPTQADRSGDLIRAAREGWRRHVRAATYRGRAATVSDAALGRLDCLRDAPTLLLLTGIAALDLALARLAWEHDERQG